MINFACRKINMEDIIKCSFSLNKTAYNVLSYLMQADEWKNVMSISKDLGLERSGVQKAIKVLLGAGLIKRKQKNMPSGGYIYFYTSIPKSEIKEKLMSIIREWENLLEKEAEKWVSG